MNLTYSYNDIVSFLEKRGYILKDITVEVPDNVYHNKVEYHDRVFTVLYHGADRFPAMNHQFHSGYVKEVFVYMKFEEIFRKELLELLDGQYFSNK